MRSDVETWRRQEIAVEIHEPGPDNPRYTALAQEFGLEGTGDTLDHAIEDVFARIAVYAEPFLKTGQPLPMRQSHDVTTDDRIGEGSE